MEHKLHARAFDLESQASYPLPHRLSDQAEKLDKLRMDGVAYANKKCRKLFMGGVPYSLEFQ
jgi:hypothetical protein